MLIRIEDYVEEYRQILGALQRVGAHDSHAGKSRRLTPESKDSIRSRQKARIEVVQQRVRVWDDNFGERPCRFSQVFACLGSRARI